MASSSKRQTTMAKIAREQSVREKRARKQEKKDDKKQAAVDALTAEAEGELAGDGETDADGTETDVEGDAEAVDAGAADAG
jgi:hypothetical protein